MREPSLQTGTALAGFVAAAIVEFEGTTAAGLHPVEVCIALGAVAGARLGVTDISDEQIELMLASLVAGARQTISVARDGAG